MSDCEIGHKYWTKRGEEGGRENSPTNNGMAKTVSRRSLMVRLAMNIFVVRRRIERLNKITLQTSKLPNSDKRIRRLYAVIMIEFSSDQNCSSKLNGVRLELTFIMN